MAGKVLLFPERGPVHQATRVIFHRDDGMRVVFRDTRVFGRVQALPRDAIEVLPEIAGLGPEPLDRGFRPRHLAAALGGTRRPVKVALLDQTRVAGIGNIQAAEALFRARLHPARPGSSLTDDEVHRLWKSMRAALRDTLRRERAPEIAYVEEAGAPNPFRVYGREGEPCPRCRRPIARVVQASRSTYFCPGCQRVNRRRRG
jgi:formamidopyrimidine-DNA glycosylase